MGNTTMITFNTHRLYQAEGQIITAKVIDRHTCLFNDHSRGISGAINTPIPKGYHIPEFVMHHYDLNNYRWDHEAMNLERQAHVESYRR